MDIISQSESHERDNLKFAVASSITAGDRMSKVNDGEKNNGFSAFSDDGLTFDDFIDIINPLHHIPVIGTVYRKMTGDELGSVSKVLGGSLFLGPLGAVSAIANILVYEATDKDVTEHVMALFENTESDQPKLSSANPKSKNISLYSNNLTKKTNSERHTDPVTAWAIAEASYRQSALEPISTADNATYEQQNKHGSIPSETQTANVTEWARAETSFRKAAFKPGLPSKEDTKLVTAHAQVTTPKNNVNDLSALKSNLLAGGSQSTEYAAAKYARQQSMPIKRHNPEAERLTAKTTMGSIETGGGWFSNTLLSALGKHNETEKPIFLSNPSKVFNENNRFHNQ